MPVLAVLLTGQWNLGAAWTRAGLCLCTVLTDIRKVFFKGIVIKSEAVLIGALVSLCNGMTRLFSSAV